MLFSTNYHTHSNLCDGKNTLEEMAEAAYSLGLKTLGFSGHSYTSYDESYCMSKEGTIDYKRRIGILKEKYKGRMNILMGIEQDFGSDEPTIEYDYVIGSVHTLFPRCGELSDMQGCSPKDNSREKTGKSCSTSFHGYDRSSFCYVDWSPERMKKDIYEHYNGDPYSFAEHYFEMVAMLPEVTNCDIIGHFDLITKFNEKGEFFDIQNPRYTRAWNRALDELLKKDVIFEINTGAIARGYRTEPYPSPEILKRLSLEKARIVINSDAHSASKITAGFDKAYELLDKYSLRLVSIDGTCL